MTWEPWESQKAHWDSDISCDEAFHNFWSIEVVAQTIYHVFLIQTFNSLLEIVLYLTYIGKRQRECPLHHKPYLDIQSINAYHPTKGAQVRPTISWLNLGQLESKWVDHLSPHACIFHYSPTGLHYQCCSSNAIQVQEKQSICLPHSLEVSTRTTYAGGTTEEDDALLEETLCKTTDDIRARNGEQWTIGRRNSGTSYLRRADASSYETSKLSLNFLLTQDLLTGTLWNSLNYQCNLPTRALIFKLLAYLLQRTSAKLKTIFTSHLNIYVPYKAECFFFAEECSLKENNRQCTIYFVKFGHLIEQNNGLWCSGRWPNGHCSHITSCCVK